ncbi:MAG: aminotransferase class I/II-fold pyridoxal phosphate-dependent enzyme [Gemmatimonadetes bacterium]|nr:aminotransferase class I/II-fold pyridoxal phosphate-dependent enzyme [Gemmatimonadota bacterium]
MPLYRRYFVSALGLGGVGLMSPPLLSGRGSEGRLATWARDASAPERAGLIRLDSNENPNGPGARAIEALQAMLHEANRYPDAAEVTLMEAIAREHGVSPANVVLGAGSGEILRMCVEAYTSTSKHLVSAAPTFEPPARFARLLGRPVVEVPVDSALRLDLDAMAARSTGAGLVFFCNPNNPTATVHGEMAVKSFVGRIRRASPETVILVDEAYHEYVDDRTYATAIPMAVADPKVVVSRTFSKVFGMAGLRAGYAIAHADTARLLREYRVGSGTSVLALATAAATIGDHAHIADEQRKNREAKAFTRAFFEGAGYKVGPSDTNFLMIDLRRDPQPVRAACRQQGIAVGRPFPPLDTWLRLSIGTMDEMRQATAVLRTALG